MKMQPTHANTWSEHVGQSPTYVASFYKHSHKLGPNSPFSRHVHVETNPAPDPQVQIIQDQKHRVVKWCEFLKTLDNLTSTQGMHIGFDKDLVNLARSFGDFGTFKLVIGEALLVGGIPTPLKNMIVNWEDETPNIWKNKTCSKLPPSL